MSRYNPKTKTRVASFESDDIEAQILPQIEEATTEEVEAEPTVQV